MYIQNDEQKENSIWQRIRSNRNVFKPIDILYREYAEHGFNDIDLSNQDQSNPEIQILIKYVEDIKAGNIKFDDIPDEYKIKLAEILTRE